MKKMPIILTGTAAFAVGLAGGSLIVSSTGLSSSDFLAFAGALTGTALTIAGGIYILDRERHREDRERNMLLISLLDEIDGACLPFQLANEAALKERYGVNTKKAVANLIAAVARLRAFKDRLEPQTVQMLKVSDAIDAFSVDETGMQKEATACAFYPESADYGGLNYSAHDIMSNTKAIRELLS